MLNIVSKQPAIIRDIVHHIITNCTKFGVLHHQQKFLNCRPFKVDDYPKIWTANCKFKTTNSHKSYIRSNVLEVNLILWFMAEHMSDWFWFDAIISHVVFWFCRWCRTVCVCLSVQKQLRNVIVVFSFNLCTNKVEICSPLCSGLLYCNFPYIMVRLLQGISKFILPKKDVLRNHDLLTGTAKREPFNSQ